jgi:hypothetical protein
VRGSRAKVNPKTTGAAITRSARAFVLRTKVRFARRRDPLRIRAGDRAYRNAQHWRLERGRTNGASVAGIS